jgi:hypothetical protein
MRLDELQTQAIDYLEAQHAHPSESWLARCLGVTRRAFQCPPMANAVPAGGTAYLAYQRCPKADRHPFSGDYSKLPAGRVFVWKGGSKGAGHIVTTDGDGWCWSNDVLRPGKIDRVRMARIERDWRMDPLGMIDVLNGKRIYAAADLDLSRLQQAAAHPREQLAPVMVRKVQRAMGAKFPTGRWGRLTRRRWKRRYPDSKGLPTAWSVQDFAGRHGLTWQA